MRLTGGPVRCRVVYLPPTSNRSEQQFELRVTGPVTFMFHLQSGLTYVVGPKCRQSRVAQPNGIRGQDTAEWRYRKAKDFPNDDRNLNAANELGRLAEQIAELEGSEIHQKIRVAQDSINAASRATGMFGDAFLRMFPLSFAHRVSLRLRPGAQFLQFYHDLLRETLQALLGEAVDEQVVNDPTVAADKQTYDEVCAKARPAPRKRVLRDRIAIVKAPTNRSRSAVRATVGLRLDQEQRQIRRLWLALLIG